MTTAGSLTPVIDLRTHPRAGPRDYEDLPIAVLVVTRPDLVEDVNPGWTRLTGLSLERSAGHGWTTCVHTDDLGDFRRSLSGGVAGTIDVRLQCAPAHGPPVLRWTRWHWIDTPSRSHKVVAVVDIDADRSRELKLSERAAHDPLTGVLNRSQFFDTLTGFVQALDGDRALAVLFVDLDRFKEVNDHGGHHVGDAVLGRVAQRLEGALRPGDALGRLGGDEFGVICADLPRDPDIAPLVERVQRAFRDPFDVSGGLWEVAATVGVAVTDSSTTSAECLVQEADARMYAAKRSRPSRQGAGARAGRDTTTTDGSHLSTLLGLDALRVTLEDAVHHDGVDRERGLVEALGRLDSLIGRLRGSADGSDPTSDIVTEARHALLAATDLLTRLWTASLAGEGPATEDAARLGEAARQVRAALIALGPQVVR